MENSQTWNWNPVTVKRDKQKHELVPVPVLHEDVIWEGNMINEEWKEIPLMFDDEVLPSPRGTLVFKGNSESDSYISSVDGSTDTEKLSLSETVVEIEEETGVANGSPNHQHHGWGWKIMEDAARALATKRNVVAPDDKTNSENEKLKKLLAHYKKKHKQMSINYEKLRATHIDEHETMKEQLKMMESKLQDAVLNVSLQQPYADNGKISELESIVDEKEKELKHFRKEMESFGKDHQDITKLKSLLLQKDKQLEDAKKALEIAHTRADQIRSRLVNSTNSQRNQSTQLRSLTKSLADAMEQAAKFKKDSKNERIQAKKIENQLNDSLNSAKDLQMRNIDLSRQNSQLETEKSEMENALREMVCGESKVGVLQLTSQVKRNLAQCHVEIILNEIISSIEWQKETEFKQNICRDMEEKHATLDQENDSLIVELKHEKNSNLQMINERMELLQTFENTKQKQEQAVSHFQELLSSNEQYSQRLKQSHNEVITNLQSELQKSVLKNTYLMEQNHRLQNEINRLTQVQKVDAACQIETDTQEKSIECDLEKNVTDNLQQQVYALHEDNQYLHTVIDRDRYTLSLQNDQLHDLNESCRHLEGKCRYHENRLRDMTSENLKLQNMMAKLSKIDVSSNSFIAESEMSDIPDSASVINIKSARSLECVEVEPSEVGSVATTQTSNNCIDVETNSKPSDDSVMEVKKEDHLAFQRHQMPTPEPPISVVNWTPAPSESSVSLGSKGRRRKTKSKGKSTLPEWRQENPNNYLNEGNQSWNYSGASTLVRRIGPPLSEDAFNSIMTSCSSLDQSRDDGYHSASTEYTVESYSAPWNITQRFNTFDEVENVEVESHHDQLTDNIEQINMDPDEKYIIEYKGVKFDALNCNIALVRQLASESGINDSSEGMCEFFDFLSKTSEELNRNKKLAGKHTLGEASDWQALKQHYDV